METQENFAVSVWRVAAARLQERHANIYRDWFAQMVPVRLEKDGTELILGVSCDFYGEWVESNYRDLLDDALADINGQSYAWAFEKGYEPVAEIAEAVPAVSQAPSVPQLPIAPQVQYRETFENFVVGDANRFAVMTTQATVAKPGLYNPLFLYGDSGVGKTHLLCAAAVAAQQHNHALRTRYMSCSELLDRFYELISRHTSLSEFRASLRDVDMLLVDDVHVLARKPQIQEEFFNLFNYFYNQQKQIILTSDKQPCEIEGLEPRLVTRFESGVTAEVCVPEVEGRLMILRKMRDETLLPARLADPILEFIAEQISSSVRRLKGAFMRLASLATACGDVTMEQAEQLLAPQIDDELATRVVSMEVIQQRVAEQFGISMADLMGNRRPRNIAEPRMVAMYLCRRHTRHSLPEIGNAFGKTHATVLNAMNKVPELCRKDDALRTRMRQIEKTLGRKGGC